MAKNWWESDPVASDEKSWWANDPVAEKPEARQPLPENVTPSVAGAGRGSINPAPVEPRDDRGLIQRAKDFISPQYKSVLEDTTVVPTVDAELNRQAMERSGSPESVMFTAGRAKAEADRLIARGPQGSMTSFEDKNFFQKLADKTIAKPEDNSLGGAVLETAGDAVRGIASGVTSIPAAGWDALYMASEKLGGLGDFSAIAREAGAAGRQSQANWGNAKDPNSVTKAVFESTTQMLVAAGLTGGFGNASIALSSGVSAANAYGEARQAGKNPDQASERAAVNFLSEFLGEKVALPALKNVIGKMGGAGSAKEFAEAMGNLVTRDVAGEQVTTAVQDLYDKFGSGGLRPNMTVKDYLDDVAQTFKVTIGQAALMGGAGLASRKYQQVTDTPEKAFARELNYGVENAQWIVPASQVAREQFNPYNAGPNVLEVETPALPNIPTSFTARPVEEDNAQINRGLGIIAQAQDADGAIAAAAELAGTSAHALPTIATAAAPIGVTPEATTVSAPSSALEQQFGLDKLRLNTQGAPAPIQAAGGPAAPIAPLPIAAPTPALAAPSAPVAGTKTITPAELGQMRLGDRRQLAKDFDQTENADGTITFTPKKAPSAVPAAETFVAIPDTGSSAVPDAIAAGVDGTAAASTARAAAQTAIDNWAVSTGVESPARLNAPAPELEAGINQIAQALGSQFGGRIVAYSDPSPSSVNGFALDGAAFINTSTDVNVMRTSLHEFKHTVEQIAAAETKAGLTNTPAQQFTASIDSIFNDMTDEGKRAYVENFLHKDELAGITDPVAREQRIQELLAQPILQSEMTADFLGNRATDKRFWADVAKADPQGFKGFVEKWVKIIDGLLTTLRGPASQKNKESALVDKYVRDLNKAKMVAREALIAYSKGTLQASATNVSPAFSRAQGETNARSITAAGGQGLPSAAGPIGSVAGQVGGNQIPSYGTARQGAVSVVGRHYSTAARQSLTGAAYGRGLKGAERDRLDRSTDPRLKNRIYFYVDQGAGIRPESGVGAYAHEVRLENIYDPQTRIVKSQGDANAFESAVINAGFDGYIAPFGSNQAAVVLLGMKHKAVPVQAIGTPAAAAAPEAAAPTTLKKGLMSKELGQIDTSKIPGAQVRMGNLEIPAEQTEAANAELARIDSDVRFAKKQVAAPVEEAAPVEGAAPVEEEVIDLGTFRDVAKRLDLSEAEYNASALGLMTGFTKDKAFKTPQIGGIPEVVQWLDKRHQESGMPVLDLNKAEDRSILARMMAAEAIGAIRSAGNAVEWYDETVAKTLQIMAVKYPELNTDQNARNAFLMATAISSQTMNVEDNLRYASNQYEAFRKTGSFPEVGTGKSAPAMAKNFALANELLSEMGPELLRRFLQTELTKRELESAGFSIGGESMDEKVLGSAVFGPKIGFGFYSNLTGNFEPVTMDMWFMRTVGRLAGTLPAFDEVLFPKQVAKLRAALAETGDSSKGVYAADFDPADVAAAQQSDEGAIALARKVFSLHNRQFIKERAAFDAGVRKKTALVGAAGAILKSADKPTDSPSSGGERQRLRDVVRQMVALVETQTGKRVPPAALQALIWYPEQELYKKLGVRLRVTSQDYAGAAKSLLTKEGFNAKRINTAAKSGSRKTQPVAGEENAGAAKANGGAPQKLGPLEGEERAAFIGQRAAKTLNAEAAKLSLPEIFEGLGKRGLAKTKAEAAVKLRADAAQIQFVQTNFLDILEQLDDSGLVEINCD